MVMIITLLLTACSNSEAELTSADDTSVVLEQEAEPTATSTAADGEKDTDTGEEIVRPEGWGEATHDKSADPNYDVVFPQEEVNRIDIVINPADWNA
jgi:hypothetical protein